MSTGNPFKTALQWKKPGELLDQGRKKAKQVSPPRESRWFDQRKEHVIKQIKVFSEEVVVALRELIYSYPSLDEIHAFYRSLIEVWSSASNMKAALNNIWSAQFRIRSIAGEYVQQVDGMALEATANGEKEAVVKELVDLQKTAFKDIASVVQDLSEDFSYIVRITKKLARIPDYNPQLPAIVVAGPPNSGKSTFVKQVSTANVETASYPFTTKKITFGHTTVTISRFLDLTAQICDTPGLFDRSLEQRKEPEILAIKAIKHLADALVILLDASLTNPLGIAGQKKIYNTIRLFFQQETYVVAINKMDVGDDEVVASLEAMLDQRKEPYINMSVRDNTNVDVLFERLANIFEGSRFLTQTSQYTSKEQENEQIIDGTQENRGIC